MTVTGPGVQQQSSGAIFSQERNLRESCCLVWRRLTIIINFQKRVVPNIMAQSMYALKPVFDLDAKVDIPSCMYSLPVIQSSTPIDGIGMTKVKDELFQFIIILICLVLGHLSYFCGSSRSSPGCHPSQAWSAEDPGCCIQTIAWSS